MSKLLTLDPSGNFYEGKGTTGWSLYLDNKLISLGQLRAEEYNSQITYWLSHLELIKNLQPDVLVVEAYVLYAGSAKVQIGSSLETSQLIGIIKYYCYLNKYKLVLQPAKIKNRYTNKILLHKNIITQDVRKRYYALGVPITRHILDAIRHAEYYINFTSKKKMKGE